MLDSKFAYDFQERSKTSYKQNPVNESNFVNWTKSHRFRSTYTDSYNMNKARAGNKNSLPGYGGYVPGIKCENLIGGNFSSLSKKGFKGASNSSNIFANTSKGG